MSLSRVVRYFVHVYILPPDYPRQARQGGTFSGGRSSKEKGRDDGPLCFDFTKNGEVRCKQRGVLGTGRL